MSPIITATNFGYAYPPTRPGQEPSWVLQEVNLAIEEGEFVALMGRTGAGKTTFCLALNGIVPHHTGGTIRGDVFVGGINTKKHPVAELARLAGVVFQDPEEQLFHVTVEAEVAFGLENLGFPAEEIQERVAWALSLVGAQHLSQHSPAHLSGGEKQRVAIASVLAMTPKILVLDEPTANLDPRGKAEVFSVVNALRRTHEMTVVLASHESEYIAEFSDRAIVLDGGRVLLDGRPKYIFAQIQAMQEAGLRVPQVSELADCLNQIHGTEVSFHLIDEAYRALANLLHEQP